MITVEGLLYKEEKRTFDELIEDDFFSEKEIKSYIESVRYTTYNEIFLFDYNEKIYKKRKVYFHISPYLFSDIKAVCGEKRSIPTVYFSMDIKMCINLFKNRYDVGPAFIYRCVNNRAINLFNPESKKDIDSLQFTPENKEHYPDLFSFKSSGDKRLGFLGVLEQDYIMQKIYSQIKCDGIALDINESMALNSSDKVEGFCLFDRGTSAIQIMNIARIDNIQTSKINYNNLRFYKLNSFQYEEWFNKMEIL